MPDSEFEDLERLQREEVEAAERGHHEIEEGPFKYERDTATGFGTR